MNVATKQISLQRVILSALVAATVGITSSCAVDGDTGKSALLGALAGCAIGETSGGKCGKGALIGAAVGAAAQLIGKMIIESRSAQVKDEAETQKTYLVEHPTLPEKPTLVHYRRFTLPEKAVTAGTPVKVKSDIEVVPGKEGGDAKLTEEIAIYDVDQKTLLKSLKKDVNGDQSKAGTYSNEFSFTLPQGMPEGVYPIKTELYLNGNSADKTTSMLQVIAAGGGVAAVAAK